MQCEGQGKGEVVRSAGNAAPAHDTAKYTTALAASLSGSLAETCRANILFRRAHSTSFYPNSTWLYVAIKRKIMR
jgi:hypothetical protein